MKIKSLRTSTLLLVASALLLALLGAGCKTVEREEPLSAWAMRLKGAARCSKDQRDWRAVQVGDKFSEPGWTFEVASNSYLDLLFPHRVLRARIATFPRISNTYAPAQGATYIRLQPDSTVRLRAMTARYASRGWDDDENAIEIDLVQGTVFVSAPTTAFEISTPGAAVRIVKTNRGIPGAVFEINSEGLIQALGGAVEFSQPSSTNHVEVPAGQAFDSRTGTFSPVSDEVYDKYNPGCPGGLPMPYLAEPFKLPGRNY